MLFAPYERCHYARSPIVEVVCQLRFPTILSIDTTPPAAFQEAIRQEFPNYSSRQENAPPKLVPGNPPTMQQQPPVTNYQFISADNRWKLNLTKDFISLSTRSYQRWEDFATRLDHPLAQFIQHYQPAHFSRIGLRYVNAISKQAFGMGDALWDDLIQSAYVGILGEPDVDETTVRKNMVNIELGMGEGYHFKGTAGLGQVQVANKKSNEVRFILDSDMSAVGTISTDQVPMKLEDLHQYAVRQFRGAITNELHNAMGPTLVAE